MKKLGSIFSTRQFDREMLDAVFSMAKEMSGIQRGDQRLSGYVSASLFYEQSTRTRFSFEAAMKRLGGEVIGTENAREFSSKAKGETLEDTLRVVSCYCDLIVLRYYKELSRERIERLKSAPIINAGDGAGQHPTQALLDVFTIRQEFGKIENLNIVLMGDLLNGRTVRSLCYLLAKHYSKNTIHFVSPEQVRMKKDIKDYLNRYSLPWKEYSDLDDVLEVGDIFYTTRVQSERFEDNGVILEQVKRAKDLLSLDMTKVERMKQNAIIMHPLPRNVTDISYEVDNDKRARYFKQAQNGLYVRMALLTMMLIGY